MIGVNKGKGFLEGPFLDHCSSMFFIDNLFYLLEHLCTLYNYADDNSMSLTHQDMTALKLLIEMSADVAVEWFWNNNMQANPSTFQGIVISRGNEVATQVTLNIIDVDIPVNENVKC